MKQGRGGGQGSECIWDARLETRQLAEIATVTAHSLPLLLPRQAKDYKMQVDIQALKKGEINLGVCSRYNCCLAIYA